MAPGKSNCKNEIDVRLCFAPGTVTAAGRKLKRAVVSAFNITNCFADITISSFYYYVIIIVNTAIK